MTEPGRAAAERVAEALRLGRELRPAKGVRMDPAAVTARLRRVAQLRELSAKLRTSTVTVGIQSKKSL